MKFSKMLMLGALSSILLVGCSATNDLGVKVEEGKALKILAKANEEFQKEDQYIEFEQKIEQYNETFHETKFTVREIKEVQKGTYTTGSKSQFFFATPFTVLTEGDVESSYFTQVIDYTNDDKKVTYISLDKENLIPQTTEAKNTNDILLNKEEVSAVIKEASLVDTGSSSSGVGVFTGSDFFLKSIPEKISNLTYEEKTFEGKDYYIVKGKLKSDPKEIFLIFEETDVEIWIEKKTSKVFKEIYKDSKNYSDKTGVGQIVYTYIYEDKLLTEDFKKKSIEDKLSYVKGLFEGEDSSSQISAETRSEYERSSGLFDLESTLNLENSKELEEEVNKVE